MFRGVWAMVSRLVDESWVPHGLSLVVDKKFDISSLFFLHTFKSMT